MNRRGFTLIELLVALVMLVFLAGGLYQLLVTVQRVTRRQTETANMQGNLRGGIQLVQSELQEIATNSAAGTPTSDITAMSASSITYRAMRSVGETCGITTTTTVQVRKSSYSGLRIPTATRDSILLLMDIDSTKTTDDVWVPLGITGVANGTCTVGNGSTTESWDLTVSPAMAGADIPGGAAPRYFSPEPVRIFETMQMGVVNDAGADWLGLRSATANAPAEATLIPVVGPVTSSGVAFSYYDANNSTTASLTAVKTIVVTLRGITAQTVNTGVGSALGNPTDSLVIRVQLRNAFR